MTYLRDLSQQHPLCDLCELQSEDEKNAGNTLVERNFWCK